MLSNNAEKTWKAASQTRQNVAVQRLPVVKHTNATKSHKKLSLMKKKKNFFTLQRSLLYLSIKLKIHFFARYKKIYEFSSFAIIFKKVFKYFFICAYSPLYRFVFVLPVIKHFNVLWKQIPETTSEKANIDWIWTF